jgi:hypothetical protein
VSLTNPGRSLCYDFIRSPARDRIFLSVPFRWVTIEEEGTWPPDLNLTDYDFDEPASGYTARKLRVFSPSDFQVTYDYNIRWRNGFWSDDPQKLPYLYCVSLKRENRTGSAQPHLKEQKMRIVGPARGAITRHISMAPATGFPLTTPTSAVDILVQAGDTHDETAPEPVGTLVDVPGTSYKGRASWICYWPGKRYTDLTWPGQAPGAADWF